MEGVLIRRRRGAGGGGRQGENQQIEGLKNLERNRAIIWENTSLYTNLQKFIPVVLLKQKFRVLMLFTVNNSKAKLGYVDSYSTARVTLTVTCCDVSDVTDWYKYMYTMICSPTRPGWRGRVASLLSSEAWCWLGIPSVSPYPPASWTPSVEPLSQEHLCVMCECMVCILSVCVCVCVGGWMSGGSVCAIKGK